MKVHRATVPIIHIHLYKAEDVVRWLGYIRISLIYSFSEKHTHIHPDYMAQTADPAFHDSGRTGPKRTDMPYGWF